MSHSTVLVVLDKGPDPTDAAAINDALTKALEPFDENTQMDPFRVYEEDKVLRSLVYSDPIVAAVLEAGGGPVPEHPVKDDSRSDEEHKRVWKEYDAQQTLWGAEAVKLLGSQRIIDLWGDEEPIGLDEEKGWFRMSTYNPKSRWDWWSLGGRWRGMLKPKAGAIGFQDETWKKFKALYGEEPSKGLDAMRFGDIDLDGMAAEARAEAEKNWDEAQKLDKTERWWKFGIDAEETREQYLTRVGKGLRTFAILLDGEWLERGQMGWFGVVHDEKEIDDWEATYEKILASIDPDRVVAVVDVHI